jgi:NAD-reducing hydrogenase small subunit
MSTLDMDEKLIPLAEKVEVVHSPLVDMKEIPGDVDLFLISGAVSTDKDVKKVKEIREKSRVVVSLGDCAVTGNVPSLRNLFSLDDVTERVYSETGTEEAEAPHEDVPQLLERVRPVHSEIEVDAYIQGCPPGADLIHFFLGELAEGRLPGRGIRTTFG